MTSRERGSKGKNDNPLLVVATGDPEGIGPAVSIEAARAWRTECPGARCILVGSVERLDPACEFAGVEDVLAGRPGLAVMNVPDAGEVRPGEGPSRVGGGTALRVLTVAEECVRAAAGRRLVTAPVSKAAIDLVAPPFVGHTDWLAKRCGVPHPVMLFVAGALRVALATVHVPLAEVPVRLSAAGLDLTLRVLAEGLATWFGCEEPRIAVLGLNPHAGEGGLLGQEESATIVPAIRRANDRGLRVDGPFSADAFFARRRDRDFDAVLALYHDQGLIPVKCLGGGEAVNVTLGLPYLRTSVDHGTAFDLVARGGQPEARSMLAALRVAHDAGR